MKENFISMAPDEESNAKVSLIDQNKTLMIDQYTTDVEAGNPEFVEDIQNINDAFEHFKPKVRRWVSPSLTKKAVQWKRP